MVSAKEQTVSVETNDLPTDAASPVPGEGSTESNLPPSGAGARLQQISSERKVKTYAIQENELVQISALNSQSTGYYVMASAIASFVLSIGIDIAREYKSETDFSPVDSVLVFFGLPIAAIIILFFVYQGWNLSKSRRTMIETIKNETESGWQSENTSV